MTSQWGIATAAYLRIGDAEANDRPSALIDAASATAQASVGERTFACERPQT
jgi:hypothetical protein